MRIIDLKQAMMPLLAWLYSLFFLSMLVLPTSYTFMRGSILIVLLISVLILAVHGSWRIQQSIILWTLFVVTVSLLQIVLGLINDNPGAVSVATVYVLWPLVYTFIIGAIYSKLVIVRLYKIIVLGAILVFVMAFYILLAKLLSIDFSALPLFYEQGAVMGFYDGRVEYRLFNMSTAIYSIPFMIALLMSGDRVSFFSPGWNRMVWIGLFCSLSVLIISGRRAFWLSAVISPFIVVLLYYLSGYRANIQKMMARILLYILPIIISVSLYAGIDYVIMWQDFISGFDFNDSQNYSSYRRREQFVDLVQAWMNEPLVGAGHGATVDSQLHQRLQPWAYELSYIALLYQTGIVGIMVYGGAVVWVFARGILIARENSDARTYIIPVLSAFLVFLVVNATNPYLQKFDYLWTLFLPVAVINVFMCERNVQCR